MAPQEDIEFKNGIEKDLRKVWKKKLLSPFAKAVASYELIKEGDRVAVCMSGGKDSTLMAKLFQELKRHRKVNFDLAFILMNPGYSPEDLTHTKQNMSRLGIPVMPFKTDIFDIVYHKTKSPCYLCARMRRGYLYAKARELNCNKIALGHHYDDVIETILMGMLYGGQIQTMMPKLHSTNFPGMELIRPMYLVREDDIKRWRDENGLNFLHCACRFTKEAEAGMQNKAKLSESTSKRLQTKLLIRELKKTNPDVESHIFKSVENVNLDTLIAYKLKGKRHHFLDTY